MNEEKFNSTELPEKMTPLEYQSKAFKKEMPPIIILKESTPGSHAVKMKVMALGEENVPKVKQFDELAKVIFEEKPNHGMFNQEPFFKAGPIIQSGWEFLGADSTKESPFPFQKTKDIAEKLGLPIYYQDGTDLYLVKPSITESSELHKLVKNNN